MDLRQALRADRSIRLALVGAGGKTTALFTLARQLDPPVWVTTSTHLGVWQSQLADKHHVIVSPDDLEMPAGGFASSGVVLFSGPEVEPERLGALPEAALEKLRQMADREQIPLLVEADGSRRLPLKAPSAREPAVPQWCNVVCVVCGLSALGQPLNSSNVHRAEEFSVLTRLSLESPVSIDNIAAYLRHLQGGLKNIPEQARKVVLLNQADREELVAAGNQIADRVLGVYDSVLVAALGQEGSPVYACREPAAGIILAAGAAERFGQAKVLLDWHGQPFVRHVAEKALQAGLDPVVVVTGHLDREIQRAVDGLPVMIANNPDWAEGQSSSLKTGLRGVAEHVGSALFLLADQPHVPASILRRLVDLHSRTLAPVIAPRVRGHRANPVLFDRKTFADLLSLEGDVGGRAVFKRYAPEWLDVEDERLLLDVDTPEDYQKLLNMMEQEEE